MQIVQAAPDPLPPGTYARERVPTPAVQTCASRIPSEAASCLLATNEEAAFPALLVLIVPTKKGHGPRWMEWLEHEYEGFVGTALVERLLRGAPDCTLVLLIRPSKRHDPTERARREIFKNNAFDRLKAELAHAFAAPETSYRPLSAADVIARNRG